MKKLSLVFNHLKENEFDETSIYANLYLKAEVWVVGVEKVEFEQGESFRRSGLLELREILWKMCIRICNFICEGKWVKKKVKHKRNTRGK